MEILLLCFLMASLLMNMGTGIAIVHLKGNPIEKVEYREIEVVRRAICECGHESSKHAKNGGCQQQLFTLDGVKTKTSYECYCVKYVGPVPITDYLDERVAEIESRPLKELS